MLKNIRGIVSFKACGENIYKFINGIRESSIVCTSQYCKNSFFFGQVYKRDGIGFLNLQKNTASILKLLKKEDFGLKPAGIASGLVLF